MYKKTLINKRVLAGSVDSIFIFVKIIIDLKFQFKTICLEGEHCKYYNYHAGRKLCEISYSYWSSGGPDTMDSWTTYKPVQRLKKHTAPFQKIATSTL